MPGQNGNHVMYGTQGMFGKQIVFRMRGGKMFVSAAPQFKEDRVASADQLTIREKFKFCIAYVKAAVKVLLTKQAYLAVAEEGQTAANVAFQDAYNAPVVSSIDRSNYAGQIGDRIRIYATDDFKVASVQVAIYTSDNELVEQGAAVPDANGLSWMYTATEDHVALEGSTIKATAKDLPGNEGSLEITL